MGPSLLRDELEKPLNLPAGPYEIPPSTCDRLFRPDGQLDYPQAPWTSEYNGNAILLNGKLFPFFEVEPRLYRFRIFNTSNAGFFVLSFSDEGRSLVPGREPFWMIGADQGLLSEPIPMKSLAITPGERADLIMDFTPHAGKEIYLKNATGVILKIMVTKEKIGISDSTRPERLRPIRRMTESEATKTRELTLNHHLDDRGQATLMLLGGMHYSMPVTGNPSAEFDGNLDVRQSDR